MRALKINEKHFGKDHPETGITLINLGAAYYNFNDLKKSYEYQKRAYDIFLKSYGPGHQHTKLSYQYLQDINHSNNLNSLFGVQSNNPNPTYMQNLLNLLMGLPRNNP